MIDLTVKELQNLIHERAIALSLAGNLTAVDGRLHEVEVAAAELRALLVTVDDQTELD